MGLQLEVAEAEGVGDYADGTEAHGGGGEDGAEQDAEEGVEDAGGDGDSEGVVDEGEEKILADVAHGGLAQLAGAEDSGEVSFDEGDAAAFHGDVGAGAHGDADVGLREGGGVVDAVAGHGDDSSLLLEFADDFEFTFGKDFGFEFGDAEFLCRSPRRRSCCLR